jgi:uncharacterized membrane protein (DUF373 family)
MTDSNPDLRPRPIPPVPVPEDGHGARAQSTVWSSMRKAAELSESGIMEVFRKAVDLVVKLMIPLVVVALMMGIARLFLDLWAAFRAQNISTGFDLLISDILSMFVVIELLKSIVDYFEVHRLKLTLILDAALVFTLREVMIGVYRHTLQAGDVAALAALLLVIGGVRIGAVLFLEEDAHEAA